MANQDAILKRLKDAEAKLDSAQEASKETTEIIKESKRTLARAKKEVQVLDTSKATKRNRRAGKPRQRAQPVIIG